MTPSRTLPCGCRLDGRYICHEHERESVARFDPSVDGRFFHRRTPGVMSPGRRRCPDGKNRSLPPGRPA